MPSLSRTLTTDQLPDLVLVKIFTLSSQEDRQCNISAVCRRWHHLEQECWTSYSLKLKQYASSTGEQQPALYKRIADWFRARCRRIQVLKLRWSKEWHDVAYGSQCATLTASILTAFVDQDSALTRLDTIQGSFPLELLKIAARLTSLTSLTVTHTPHDSAHVWDVFCTTGFSSLEVLCLDCGGLNFDKPVVADVLCSLPSGVRHLLCIESLRELELQGVHCGSWLPLDARLLRNLEKLRLEFGFITAPLSLGFVLQLQNLRSLNISTWMGRDQAVDSLMMPESLHDLVKLEDFTFSVACPLPQFLKTCAHLTSLTLETTDDLGAANIYVDEDFEDVLGGLVDLKCLTIMSTDLDHVPPAVLQMSCLEMLDLGSNRISSLAFGPYLSSLTELILAENCFRTAPLSLCHARRLELLFMDMQNVENDIQSISFEAMQTILPCLRTWAT